MSLGAAAGVVALLACALGAEEKKEPARKPEPPKVVMAAPFAFIAGGSPTQIRVRGNNLANVEQARIMGETMSLLARIKSKGKSDPPKPLEAARFGDSQIEVEFAAPAKAARQTFSLMLVSGDGASEPVKLTAADPTSAVSEKEPNNGFRVPQEIQAGKSILGAIGEPHDVDVFRFSARAGQKIVAEVAAGRFGSALDPMLTLYDARGAIVASMTNSPAGADALMRCAIPADGVYYLALTDANDLGSNLHVYQMTLRIDP
jgi:hypothetical protein